MKLLIAFGKALLTMVALGCFFLALYWIMLLPLWAILCVFVVILLAILTLIYSID
jgi:hypothetical protein